MSQSEGSARRATAWPSGLERNWEVSEEMLSREELLKLLVLLEKLSYKGRESEGGVGSRMTERALKLSAA